MMFDSHAHYDDVAFDDDRHQLIEKLFQECGVTGIVNAGCDIATSLYSIKLAEQYDGMYCAVGIHPQNASDVPSDWLAQLKGLLSNKKVVAIGEIGLDYHYETPCREVQKQIFELQLQLASEMSLPVVIHDRDAHADCVKILLKHPFVKGVLHCFSGSVETAKELIKNGWYISVGGVVTYKNAKQLPDVVKSLPPERILVETDAPYLSPVPYRGKRNDSSLMRFTLQKIAEIKGVTPEEVERATTENAHRLFGIVCSSHF